ncbi:hypothetical protein DL766_001597 [Monosporascus sp. MC13-8B]|uniref:Uncharacterized protein n=1 Tax=Monosporascus cannonballus TaxID=155416 RepID=A0ABY0HMQ7_9PEZI|nr:hypothetical protein DL763_006598 [Monosporascus cannonballus]RYO94469.1 hypothetical protein DL762_000565 [Monosporascus cannonballus]RYP37287.1 hypothetical protein DL766_001597 [Monosporascus sp. MC13-8B]
MQLPQFPAATHNSPRTWFITSSLSPLAVRLIRLLLAHGDYVAAALPPHEMEREDRSAEFRELVNECRGRREWRDRMRSIRCDGRSMGQCEAAIAEAREHFGRVDILLCCTSEAVIGTVEELNTSPATRDLVRDQFETIFFSQVNFIKAALPVLREQHTGHLMILTSVGGHIGTPGMPMYTAATWALEGFCDSLAYEVAPFNVKVTIVQPHKEVQTLTSKLVFAPVLSPYHQQQQHSHHLHHQGAADESTIHAAAAPPPPQHAPTVRDMVTNVLNLHPDTALPPPTSHFEKILTRYAKLPAAAADRLVMETVHALTAIGGHENPPARHIVGFDGAEAVKEKLKTVTEELEDFVDASLSVDIFESELGHEARAGGRGSGSKGAGNRGSAGPGGGGYDDGVGDNGNNCGNSRQLTSATAEEGAGPSSTTSV